MFFLSRTQIITALGAVLLAPVVAGRCDVSIGSRFVS